MARIQRLSGLKPEIVTAVVNGTQYFRLVTSKPASAGKRESLKSSLADIGIHGIWTIKLSSAQQSALAKSPAKSKSSTVSSTVTSKPAVAVRPTVTATPVAPKRPFEPNSESYFEFCLQKATAAQRKEYCNNSGFAEQSRKELSRSTDADAKYRILIDYCMRKATPNERKRKCGNQGLADAGSL
jgi:hypothetical protein